MATKGKRVIIAGSADYDVKPLYVEGVCLTASLLPGTVVEQVATGLQTNASAATVFGQMPLVADMDLLRQKTVDDAWVQNENMQAVRVRENEFVNVLVAAGNNITARGVGLSLNGSGLLKIALTDGTEQILFYSDEIINVTANALVRVRVA